MRAIAAVTVSIACATGSYQLVVRSSKNYGATTSRGPVRVVGRAVAPRFRNGAVGGA